MKNLMVWVDEGSGPQLGEVRRQLDLQVDNSLELGWSADQILLMTSFPYARGGVEATVLPTARRPATARLTSFHKTRAILAALDLVGPDERLWYHDVDAFQLRPFESFPTGRRLGFCLYTTRERLLVQGGSLFFAAAARPVFEDVLDLLVNHRCRKDEFALTDLAGEARYADWFELLDGTYNLGSTDFELRYQLASKPIKVAHFHLDHPAHRALFLDGGNELGARPVDHRFRSLLGVHGFDDGRGRAEPPEARARRVYGTTSPLLARLQRAFPPRGRAA